MQKDKITAALLKTGTSIMLAAVFFFTIVYVQATSHLWTESGQNPPSGNIPSPITAGTHDEEKQGNFGVDNLTVLGAGVFDGYVQVGDTNATCYYMNGAMRYRQVDDLKCLQGCIGNNSWTTISCM